MLHAKVSNIKPVNDWQQLDSAVLSEGIDLLCELGSEGVSAMRGVKQENTEVTDLLTRVDSFLCNLQNEGREVSKLRHRVMKMVLTLTKQDETRPEKELTKVVNKHIQELRETLRNSNVNTVTMTIQGFTLNEIIEIAETFGSKMNHEEECSFCVITVYSPSKNGRGLLICKTPKA